MTADRIVALPLNLGSAIEALAQSSIAALFAHKGFEGKRPKLGVLQIGSYVKLKSGSLIKVDEVSTKATLDKPVIIYHKPINDGES